MNHDISLFREAIDKIKSLELEVQRLQNILNTYKDAYACLEFKYKMLRGSRE